MSTDKYTSNNKIYIVIKSIYKLSIIAVAESVYMKHCATPLKMEDMLIDVKHLRNRHRPKFLSDRSIVQQNALFLEVTL